MNALPSWGDKKIIECNAIILARQKHKKELLRPYSLEEGYDYA
jgi:hypothetical protein